MSKRLLAGVFVALAVWCGQISPAVVFASTAAKDLCQGGGGVWSGSSCTNPEDRTPAGVDGLIGTIVDVFLFLTAGVSVVMIIIGALRYTASGGDQSAVKTAKSTILYAIIGLIISILAYAIVNTVLVELL